MKMRRRVKHEPRQFEKEEEHLFRTKTRGRLAHQNTDDCFVGTCKSVPTHMPVVRHPDPYDSDWQRTTAVIETQGTTILQGECGPVGSCLGRETTGSFEVQLLVG